MLTRPGLSKFQEFSDGVQKIQARCACVRWEARECYLARNGRLIQGDEYDDGDCECGCHDDIGRLEEDIWGWSEDE